MAGNRATRQAIYGFPWTIDASGLKGLSLQSQDQLLILRDIFIDIDTAISSDGRRYIQWCQGQTDTRKKKPMITSSELDKLDAMIAEEQSKTTLNSQSPDDLVTEYFAKSNLTRGNDTWRAVAASHFHYQGRPAEFEMHPGWYIAKQRALRYLDLRQVASEIMKSLDTKLQSRGLALLSRDIAVKIDCLNVFEDVYNRQPWTKRLANDGTVLREPTYEENLNARKKSQETKIATAYDQAQQDRNATLVAVVFATTLLSFIPTIFAWHRATDTHGTTSGDQFYLLLQSSFMQLLGLFTAMWPIWRKSSAHAWRWAQALSVIGASCAVASPLLFLYLPTMWSALLSFFGSAAQAGMAALLAMMVDGARINVERE